jgi:RimJ/RimL family protein N-acetyltransferase
MYDALPLLTPRLQISSLTPDDFDALHAMHNDPEVLRYFGGTPPWTLECTQTLLPRILANSNNHPLDFVAVRLRETGDFLGMVCVLRMSRRHSDAIGGGPYIEIGWRFARPHWNHGYATEAAVALRDLAFKKLQLPQLTCIVDVENGASLRVAQKLGFKRIKTYRLGEQEIMFHTLDRP